MPIRFFVLLLGTCCFFVPINARLEKEWNLPDVDTKRIRAGFHLGMNMQNLRFSRGGDDVCITIPTYTPSLALGIITTMRLTAFFDLCVVPSVYFGKKKLLFCDKISGITQRMDIQSCNLTFPVDVKFRGVRLGNYRPWLLAGLYGSYDVNRNSELVKQVDYGVEAGMGCVIYLSKFRLCPELKFCFGLPNLHTALLPGAKRTVTSRMIVFTLNFE